MTFLHKISKIRCMAAIIITGLLLCLGSYLFQSKQILVSFDAEMSKDIEYQVFYTENKEQHINTQQSVYNKVSAGNQHVEIILPIKQIVYFRLDIGQQPEKVIIKNLKISGKQTLSFDNLDNFELQQVVLNPENKDGFELVSDQQDPFIAYKNPINIEGYDVCSTKMFITLGIISFLILYRLMGYLLKCKLSDMMSRQNIIFSLIFVILCSFLYVYVNNSIYLKFSNDTFKQLDLKNNVTFYQTLPQKDIVLSKIAFRFATYGRSTPGNLRVLLYDNDNIAEGWNISTARLVDKQPEVFKLKNPIKMDKTHNYKISMTATYKTNNYIAVKIDDTTSQKYVYNNTTYYGSADGIYMGTHTKYYQVLFVSVFVLFCVYIMFLLQIKPSSIMCVILFVLAMGYLLNLPNGAAPDEFTHFYRAYEVSEGHFVSDKPGESNIGGRYLPKALMDYTNPNATIGNERTIIRFGNTALYSPINYLPQAIGIKAAKIFTDNISKIFMTARIFNFIVCFILCCLALRFLPFCKNLFFVAMISPVALQECVSLAADGFVFALTLFLLAYIVHLCYVKPQISGKDLLIVCISVIFISLCKIVYLVVLPVIYLLPEQKIQDKNINKLFKILLPICAIVLNLLWLLIASGFLHEFRPDVNEAAQLKYILTNPLNYIFTIENSVITNAWVVVLSMFGSNLGHLNIIPAPFVWVSFLIICVYQYAKLQDINIEINKAHRWVFLFIFLSGIALVYTALYVQWNAYGNEIVDGVQGRYFLPLLPFLGLFIAYSNHKKGVFAVSDNRYLCLLTTLLNEIAIIDIIKHYL